MSWFCVIFVWFFLEEWHGMAMSMCWNTLLYCSKDMKYLDSPLSEKGLAEVRYNINSTSQKRFF